MPASDTSVGGMPCNSQKKVMEYLKELGMLTVQIVAKDTHFAI